MDDLPDDLADLWALARALGALRWVERSMFEVAGAWGTTTDDPAARVLFASHSLHHGWHAEVLGDRLPELRDLDVESLTVAPDDEWAAAVAHLRGLGPAAPLRLGAWFGGVVPALLDAYDELVRRTDDVSAPSVRRWARLLLVDGREDLAAGRRLAEATGADLTPPGVVPARLPLS